MLAFLLLLLFPQHVIRHEQYPTVDHAPTAYQPRDMTLAPMGPYRLLIGENESYCVVSADAYVQTADGDLYDCRAGWQRPRY